MQITNRFNLPETLVRAVMNDEYDKGDSRMSVTQLISPPRVVQLQAANAGNLQQDVVDRIPALLGTAVHKIVEKGSANLPGHVVEERMFAEVDGWRISGAVDLQIDNGDGTWSINDYKVTGTYSVQADKPEWEQQLNCYAWLAYKNYGRRVTRLQIVAILRDWMRKQAEISPGYPQSQVVMVDVPLWTVEEQEAFIRARVAIHQSAQSSVDSGLSLVYCTDEERWLRGEVWALMKEGRKSAVKLYDNKEDAGRASGEAGAGHYVVHRPGNYVRCAGNYCLVASWCRQWQESTGDSTGEFTSRVPERGDE